VHDNNILNRILYPYLGTPPPPSSSHRPPGPLPPTGPRDLSLPPAPGTSPSHRPPGPLPPTGPRDLSLPPAPGTSPSHRPPGPLPPTGPRDLSLPPAPGTSPSHRPPGPPPPSSTPSPRDRPPSSLSRRPPSPRSPRIRPMRSSCDVAATPNAEPSLAPAMKSEAQPLLQTSLTWATGSLSLPAPPRSNWDFERPAGDGLGGWRRCDGWPLACLAEHCPRGFTPICRCRAPAPRPPREVELWPECPPDCKSAYPTPMRLACGHLKVEDPPPVGIFSGLDNSPPPR
ncbi:uncharacterized protein, partial [Narcine bancroftii]|uniref:uncharacterized protein n=1 Tax=Narcine bancroftii TaxID=1343680 RepID=UPI003831FAD2